MPLARIESKKVIADLRSLNKRLAERARELQREEIPAVFPACFEAAAIQATSDAYASLDNCRSVLRRSGGWTIQDWVDLADWNSKALETAAEVLEACGQFYHGPDAEWFETTAAKYRALVPEAEACTKRLKLVMEFNATSTETPNDFDTI